MNSMRKAAGGAANIDIIIIRKTGKYGEYHKLMNFSCANYFDCFALTRVCVWMHIREI